MEIPEPLWQLRTGGALEAQARDGVVDNGCNEWLGDWDGDGFVGDDDCNNYDSRFFKGAKHDGPDGCCGLEHSDASPEELARIARRVRGSEGVATCCKALGCAACERMVRPAVASPVRTKPCDLQSNE